MYPSRPPRKTPRAAKTMRSESCSRESSRSFLFARALIRKYAPARPNRYISPYHRNASGPRRKNTGSISGYGMTDNRLAKFHSLSPNMWVQCDKFHRWVRPSGCHGRAGAGVLQEGVRDFSPHFLLSGLPYRMIFDLDGDRLRTLTR